MLKKVVLGIIGILIAMWTFIFLTFRPTPGYLRNTEADGAKIEVQISNDKRSPIIRSFTKEEFDSFDEEKIEEINEKVGGRMEGDIPCIHLLDDEKIYINFYKDGKKLDPEKAHIKITAHASDYKDPIKRREIQGDLVREDDKTYTYASKRYSTQYEKFFIEYLRIELSYSIDGKDYVSIFATNQSNAKYGTNYSSNEDLDPPIPPEE